MTENGILYCIDPETGERLWRGELKGAFHGSPISGDGKIYIPNTDGDVAVIEAGPEFKVLATNSLGERSHASPAISNGKIFLRTLDYLYCIGEAK